VLIDVAIPRNRNVIKKEAETISRYKDGIIKIRRLWDSKSDIGNIRGDWNHM
jgi:hypothetical protein